MSKKELIREINSEVMACVKCILWKQRKHAVPGYGDINSAILFVGEAPGRQEDLKGLPFVGAAGKLLDELLNKVGLSRRRVYITNIVKCRPPKNRDPTIREVATCARLYLNRQIRIIRPKFLVLLGRHSATYILSKEGKDVEAITKIHGKAYEINFFGFPVIAIPMLHPAAALYSKKYRDLLNKDFKILESKLE